MSLDMEFFFFEGIPKTFLHSKIFKTAPKKSHFRKIPHDSFHLNYILGGCLVPTGIKILAIEKKWQRFFESVFRVLSLQLPV